MDPAASHQRSSQLEFLPGTTHKNTKSRNGTGSSTHPIVIHRSPAGGHAPAQPCRLPYPYHSSRPSSRPGSFASFFTKDGRGRSPFLLLAVLRNFSRPSQGTLLTTVTSWVFILGQRNTGRTKSCSSFPHPLPHLLWQAAPPERKKVTLSSTEPVTSSFLTKDSSWILPAGTSPPSTSSALTGCHPMLQYYQLPSPPKSMRKAGVNLSREAWDFPQKKWFICGIPLGLEAHAPFCL